MEFDIKLTPKDMYCFNLYQAYSGFQGWLSMILSVVIFVLAATNYTKLGVMYTVLYVGFGIVLLFYMPITLWIRSNHALASSEVLKNTLHYVVDEKGFTVSQGEQNVTLFWDQIYKMVATKRNVFVYSGRINAYVIPREQLGGQYVQLAQIAKQKLPKYRVKMK